MINYIVVKKKSELVLSCAFDVGESIYYGLDRYPWECVDDKYYEKKLENDLADIRSKSFKDYIGNFSAGTVRTKEAAFKLLATCGEFSKDFTVLGLRHVENNEEGLPNDSTLGYDCYIDGYGSLLVLGIFQQSDLFEDFRKFINKNGLFESLNKLREYASAYSERASSAGLEPIDDLSDMCVYQIISVE